MGAMEAIGKDWKQFKAIENDGKQLPSTAFNCLQPLSNHK